MSLSNRDHRLGASPERSSPARGWRLGAALWALAFAGVHVAWAAGSRVALVDPAAADAAFDQAWFRLYNMVVAGTSFIAAAVALLSVPRRWSVRGRWSTRVMWLAGCGLFLMAATRADRAGP